MIIFRLIYSAGTMYIFIDWESSWITFTNCEVPESHMCAIQQCQDVFDSFKGAILLIESEIKIVDKTINIWRFRGTSFFKNMCVYSWREKGYWN
jgi:hypothetical protein